MRIAISLGVLVVVFGCGGNGPDIATTQDNVCAQIASVACYDMYQCCAEGEIERLLMVSDPRTLEECQDDVETLCERQMAQIHFSLKNKHLTFDSKIMNECLESLVAPEGVCVMVSSALPWLEACEETAWKGAVADGDKCDFANECSEDSFCSASRVCTALPRDAMPCGIQGCATGLYCGAGTCHPLLAQGGTCTSTTQCVEDLFCDLAGTHTCTPLRAVGEACSANATCASNTCLPGTCAGTGGSCFASTSCFAHCADDNSFCTGDATCQAGTCSLTPTTCTLPTDCTGAGNTCVFPVKCLPATCEGNIVCGEAHVVVNYCQGALDGLPL